MLNVRSEERSKVQIFEFGERAEKEEDKQGNKKKLEDRLNTGEQRRTNCCCSELEQRFSRNFYEGAHAMRLPSLCQFVMYLQSLHLKLQMCHLLTHWRLIDRLFSYVP